MSRASSRAIANSSESGSLNFNGGVRCHSARAPTFDPAKSLLTKFDSLPDPGTSALLILFGSTVSAPVCASDRLALSVGTRSFHAGRVQNAFSRTSTSRWEVASIGINSFVVFRYWRMTSLAKAADC